MPSNPKVAAPDYDYLTRLRHDLEIEFSQDDLHIERSRRVRDLEQEVPIPNDWRVVAVEVRDPTVTDEVQRLVAELTLNPAHLVTEPTDKESEIAQTNSALRSRWTEEMLKVAATRFPGRDTRQEIVDALTGDGAAWTKFLFTKDVWDERYGLRLKDYEGYKAESGSDARKAALDAFDSDTEDTKKKAGPPFTWTLVDVRTVYPVFQANRLAEVMEISERAENTTFRQYRLGRDKDGKIRHQTQMTPEEMRPGSYTYENMKGGAAVSTVFFIEHWDAVNVSYIVIGKDIAGAPTGEMVAQWKHGYGRPPYFFAMGLSRNYKRNHKVAWGVSESKRWLVEYRSFLWTLLAQVAARDSFAPVVIESETGAEVVTGEDGQPRGKEYWEPRQVMRLKPGQKIHVLEWPDIAPSLKEQLQIVNQAIQELSTPRPTSDIGSNMEGAGFAINQVLAEVHTRHNPFVQSIERLYEEVTRFAWWLVSNKVKERVWVYTSGKNSGWAGVGPDDLKAPVSIRWMIDPEQPSAKLMETRYWSERLQQGTAYLDQAIRAMGDDPDDVRRGRAIDLIRQSQWYMQQLQTAVTQGFGRGDLTAQAAQLAATGQLSPGQPPQVGPAGVAPQAGMQGGPGGGPQDNMIPNMGALAASPNQAGVAGMPMPPGGVPGAGPGLVVPQQSALPGAQGIVTGGR
jgi:hypothetical protein